MAARSVVMAAIYQQIWNLVGLLNSYSFFAPSRESNKFPLSREDAKMKKKTRMPGQWFCESIFQLWVVASDLSLCKSTF
jgi:muconolactone delta-isomerase